MHQNLLLSLMLSTLFSFGGCVQAPTNNEAAALPAVLEFIDDIAAENGDRIVISRDYVDELKIDGRNVTQRFQYVWNYSRAVAQERVLTLDGTLVQINDKPSLGLRATEQEQEYAFSVIRADSRWSDEHNADSLFYGGFVFRQADHPVCGMKSRCIHVFVANADGSVTMLHVIFDLMTGYAESPDPEIYPSNKNSQPPVDKVLAQ